MIRSLYFTPKHPLSENLPPDDFPVAIRNRNSLLWVDCSGEPPATCEPILKQFNFHPLAIDDALLETHSPKIDDWGEYLYIVLNYMNLHRNQQNGWEIEVDEVDIFLGPNYVITHHDYPLPALDETWAACHRDLRNFRAGADHLLYKIMDNIVAGYMPLVETIDQAIDEIEDEIFERPARTPWNVSSLSNAPCSPCGAFCCLSARRSTNWHATITA